jgi:nucleoid DNA-binding protein
VVAAVAARTGLSLHDSRRLVDAILALIAEALVRGDDVRLPGLGTFTVGQRAARAGVNPRTGERVCIASARVVTFRADRALKRAVREDLSAGDPDEPYVFPSWPTYGGRLAEPDDDNPIEASDEPDTGEPIASSKGPDEAVEDVMPTESASPSPAPSPPPPVSRRRQPPARRRARPPAEAGATPDGKQVNAWVTGPKGPRKSALRPRERYELSLNVGAPRQGVVIEGERTVDPASIPAAGLDTEWLLSAADLEFDSSDAAVVVTPAKARGSATAHFALHIPRDGESEIRRVGIRPLSATPAEIELVVTTSGEIYRRLTLRLDVDAVGRSARRSSAGTPALVTRDTVETAPAHTGLAPMHEWTTPPDKLHLIVLPGGAWAKGDVGPLSIDQAIDWVATQTLLKAPIDNVRNAAEQFRAAWQSYLDNITTDELEQRLAAFSPMPFGAAPTTDATRTSAWSQIAQSQELYKLAYYGWLLYERAFPRGSDARRWLDMMPAGQRLDISWPNTASGWVSGLPWGLMYTKAPTSGAPVDPGAFLALRARIGYTTHKVTDPSKALGDPRAVYMGNLLYWGEKAGDAVASEAAWQRNTWKAWHNQVFWPEEGPDLKTRALAALEDPSPPPVTVLYLFCQSSFGGPAGQPVLGFADPIDTDCSLDATELGLSDFSSGPFVFANACTTAASDPYIANDLEQRFFERKARAYLGTETKVPIIFASRFARVFFHFFYRHADPQPMAAGEALVQTRLFFWREFMNIGGLFYAQVNQYELFLATEDEVAEMSR